MSSQPRSPMRCFVRAPVILQIVAFLVAIHAIRRGADQSREGHRTVVVETDKLKGNESVVDNISTNSSDKYISVEVAGDFNDSSVAEMEPVELETVPLLQEKAKQQIFKNTRSWKKLDVVPPYDPNNPNAGFPYWFWTRKYFPLKDKLYPQGRHKEQKFNIRQTKDLLLWIMQNDYDTPWKHRREKRVSEVFWSEDLISKVMHKDYRWQDWPDYKEAKKVLESFLPEQVALTILKDDERWEHYGAHENATWTEEFHHRMKDALDGFKFGINKWPDFKVEHMETWLYEHLLTHAVLKGPEYKPPPCPPYNDRRDPALHEAFWSWTIKYEQMKRWHKTESFVASRILADFGAVKKSLIDIRPGFSLKDMQEWMNLHLFVDWQQL